MSTLSGPSESWLIVLFPLYAAMEKEAGATAKDATLLAELGRLDEGDGPYRAGGRTMIAEDKPELNYRARGDFSGVHYVEVTIVHVRPGHTREYQEMVSASRKAHEQANVDETSGCTRSPRACRRARTSCLPASTRLPSSTPIHTARGIARRSATRAARRCRS